MPAQRTSDTQRSLVAYYAHHKCASSWIASIFARVMDEAGLRYVSAYDMLSPVARGELTIDWSPAAPFDRLRLGDEVDARSADFVTLGSADRELAAILRPRRAFHVIRDPRDLIVSGYFSHMNSHPTDGWPHLQRHRVALQSATRSEGLLLEMEFERETIEQISDWDYTDETVLEMKMEDLTVWPYDNLLRIFAHLQLLTDAEPVRAAQQVLSWTFRLSNRLSKRRGLGPLRRRIPVTAELVLGTAYARRFETRAGGRARGVEDEGSHYRKGVAGDWQNHFERRHADVFLEMFGDILERLGYEPDAHWIDALPAERQS